MFKSFIYIFFLSVLVPLTIVNVEYEAICITKNVNDDDKEGAVKYVDVEESENDKEEYFSDFLASLSDVVLIDVTVASTFIIDSASIYSLDINLPPPQKKIENNLNVLF